MFRLLRDHLANCFLLLWLFLIYFWMILVLFNVKHSTLSILFSTLLFIAHVTLYGAGVLWATKGYQRLLILSGLIGSVFLLSFIFVAPNSDISIFVVRNSNISFGFYLALCVETFHLLGQTRIVTGCIVACLLIFFLLNRWAVHSSFSFGYDLMPPLLFIGGYVVLQTQQANAHRQTQALLHELEKAHTSLQTAHAQLAAYALQVEFLSREAERQRLARELHDTHAQGLVGLMLQLEAINSHMSSQRYERASSLVTQAIQRAHDTLVAARQAIDDLRANGISPSDLPEAVQEELDRLATTTGISCISDLSALTLAPAPLCEYVLRVVTEGLTNIARHSQAERAWICTISTGKSIIIEIGDNGKGFDPISAGELIGHYGLLGLRERSRLIQGEFEVISAPGKGTTLRFTLPISQGAGV